MDEFQANDSPARNSGLLGRFATPAQESGLPRLAPGTELAGEFVGAGYREPPHLVYREDGQVVQLPAALYHVVAALDRCHRRDWGLTGRQQVLEYVAHAVSVKTGRLHQAEHIQFLLDRKLAPLGVTTYSDGSPPAFVKSQPWLSLTYRLSVLSERSTWVLAGLLGWLFQPAVLGAMIAFAASSNCAVSSTTTGGFPGPAAITRLPDLPAARTTAGPPVTHSSAMPG